jgi:hypothetical protein
MDCYLYAASWNNLHLVIVYNPLYMLIYLTCEDLVENFASIFVWDLGLLWKYFHFSKDFMTGPLISYKIFEISCDIFVYLWYQCYVGLIKWVRMHFFPSICFWSSWEGLVLKSWMFNRIHLVHSRDLLIAYLISLHGTGLFIPAVPVQSILAVYVSWNLSISARLSNVDYNVTNLS